MALACATRTFASAVSTFDCESASCFSANETAAAASRRADSAPRNVLFVVIVVSGTSVCELPSDATESAKSARALAKLIS